MTTITPSTFDTPVKALEWLGLNGFHYDFLRFNKTTRNLMATDNDFEVSHIFHIDNDQTGNDNIIYAISSHNYDLKGFIFSTSEIYKDDDVSLLLNKIQYKSNIYH